MDLLSTRPVKFIIAPTTTIKIVAENMSIDISNADEFSTPYNANKLVMVASLTPRFATEMGTLCKIKMAVHSHTNTIIEMFMLAALAANIYINKPPMTVPIILKTAIRI